jgi:hypothetical protein
MPCTLTILNVIGNAAPNSTALNSITVTGQATACSAVTVVIHCTGSGSAEHQGVPVVGGQWQTTFNAAEIKAAGCRDCEDPNDPITVRAFCSAPNNPNDSCADDKILAEIPCGACCPAVTVAVTVGACDTQGRRSVSFRVTTTAQPGCPEVFAQLEFGDGALGAGFTVPPDNVWTESHSYAPGSYTAVLHIISPAGCKDTQVAVGPLPECACPVVTLGGLSISGCVDSEDAATVTATATVAPAVAGCLLTWQFDDGYQALTQVPGNAASFSDTQSHQYASAGAHSVSVTAQSGLCSASATKGFDVPGCGGGGGGGGCNWWDPRCWGSICGALLAGAMAAFIASCILFIVSGCTVLTPAVLAGPFGAALSLLVASTLFGYAVTALLLCLALLTAWYLVCSKLPGYHFCATLHQLITAISWIIIAQSALAVGLSLIGGLGCLVGLVFAWTSWGTVLAYLQILSNAAGCPH